MERKLLEGFRASAICSTTWRLTPSSAILLRNGGSVADEEDCQEACQEVQEAPERPQDLREAKLAQTKRYRFSGEKKVQGMHLDAKYWLWFRQEDTPLPAKSI